MTWTSWWDGTNGPIARQWHVRGWPTIFVLDADGIIRFVDVHGDDLERAITTLLDEIAR